MGLLLAAVAEDEGAALEVDVLGVVADEPLGVAVLHVQVDRHVADGPEAAETAGGGLGGHGLEGGTGRLLLDGPGGGPGGGPGLLLRGPFPDHNPPGILGLHQYVLVFELFGQIWLISYELTH